MLRGSYFTKVDEKGRIKLPSELRVFIEGKWGNMLFVTSLEGVEIKIYPLPVWEEIERKLEKAPSMNPAVIKFTDLTSYYGRSTSFDAQGRVLIHPLLRESAPLDGDSILLGKHNHITLWNRVRFEEQRLGAPLTPDELQAISGLGI